MTNDELREAAWQGYRRRNTIPGYETPDRGDFMFGWAAALESLPATHAAGGLDLIEEFSFDYEPMPGLKYVTTNSMLAETMAAAKPGAKILTRWAPKWEKAL